MVPPDRVPVPDLGTLAAEFLSACVDRRQNGKEKQKGVTKQ